MKKIIKTFLLLLMIIPCIIFADSMVVTYNEAVNNANNYINRYSDRSKYLLLNNVKYIYENGYLSSDSRFIKGGMLNKSEYDLTVIANKTYLMTGREYWTLTTSNTGAKYYIDTFALSKPETGSSGVRVTEQVKGSVQVDGRGTYANPWYFIEGYEVIVKPNNSSFATITPSSQMVKGGATANLNINIKPGYKYANRDDCGLVKKNETTYEIRNVNRDISCIAIFEETIYKMVLTSSKTYTTNPSPSTLYFRPSSGWYSDSRATAKISKITPPTITGYTFNGYNYNGVQLINSTGQILTNTPTGFDYTNENQNLVADITANSYTVTYNLNGGSGCTSKSVTFDGTYGNLCTPTKTGYTFNGWYKEAAFTNKVETTTSVTTAANHNLYAKWTVNTYTVAYNANGGNGTTMTSSSHTYDAAKNLTKNTYTRTGYTFAGWATTASGAKEYNDEQSVKNLSSTNGETVTLYAKWTAHTYTVSYNANGGSGTTMTSSSHTYGVAKNLTKNTYTKTGYTFAGWATTSSGNKAYNDEQSVSNLTSTNGGSVPLYAKWKVNTYTVSFNANGGSGGQTANVTATYGAAMPTISTTKPTRSGYTFEGWYDAASGGTQYYTEACASARNYNKTSATTLYAHWKAATYTIVFNANNGVGTMSNKVCTVGANCTLPGNSFDKDDATFVMWSTNKGTKVILNTITEFSGSCSGCGQNETRNVKEFTNVVTPSVNQKFGMYCDAKGTGKIDNYFYGSNQSSYLQVSKVTTSQGGSASHIDGHNSITLTSSYQNYYAEYTMASSPSTSEKKKLLFRVATGNTGTIKNVKFFRKVGSESTYLDKATVKDLTSAGGTITLYAIWYDTGGSGNSEFPWVLKCQYEAGYNDPTYHYYPSESTCNEAKAGYGSMFACSCYKR